MDREIKFRAWNKEKEIMVYDNEDNSCDYWDGCYCSDIGMINTVLNPKYNNVYDFMQYTGLHDKNGKEIYEGDIVEYETFWEGDWEYEGGIAVIYWDNEDTSFYGECQGYHYNLDIFNLTRNLSPKVIGNIYDNPELLGGE